jgi:hypothetical protein
MAVVDELKTMHRKVILHSIERLRDGSEMNVDAMVALALADGVAPLVRIEDRFLEPSEVNVLAHKGKGKS